MKKERGDEYFMRLALREAEKAAEKDEVPVGAVIVKNGEVVARAHNEKEKRQSAVRHAEICAMEKASAKLGQWWLEDCVLYVTLEPCAMCAGAAVNARLKKIVFGAKDSRFGFVGSLANLSYDYPLNHRVLSEGGVLEKECAAILTSFFKRKRESKKRAPSNVLLENPDLDGEN